MSLGANKQALMGASGAGGAGGTVIYDYQIPYSARFDGTSTYLYKTWGAAPTSTTKKTLSVWIKKSGINNADRRIITAIGNTGSYYFMGSSNIDGIGYYAGGGGINGNMTDRKFRDPSAWMHFVAIYDSGESNDYDRIKIYINGELFALNNGLWTFNAGYPNTLTPDLGKNGVQNLIGAYGGGGNVFYGYMADFIQIDGTAAISDFGETTNGVWVPKDPSTLTFGTNGYWLDFADSTAFGNDVSGNNNDFTVAGFVASDQVLDSPTFNSTSNGGNFCTLNTAYKGSTLTAGTLGTITEGNLKHSYTNANDASCPCTIKVPPSGKWYFEWAIIAGGGSGSYSPAMGIIDPNVYTMADPGTNTAGLICYTNYLNKTRKNGTYITTYDGTQGVNGDVMGIAVDMDNGAFYVSKNGTWYSSGDPTSGASRTGAGVTWAPASEYTSGMVPISQPNGGNVPIININFGQDGTFQGTETAGGNADANGIGNFFSVPPTDYLAICAGNLTTAAAVDPAQTDDNYPLKLLGMENWTGTGSALSVTGLGFQPDFVYFKSADQSGSYSNWWAYDSNRGATKSIQLNEENVETTRATGLTAFDADGISVGASTSTHYGAENTGGTLITTVCMRANGGTTTTNTTGTEDSIVQTDPSGGFAIAQYTGTGAAMTVAHGLAVQPEISIMKDLSAVYSWVVYSKMFDGSNDYFVLNADTAKADSGLTGAGTTLWTWSSGSGFSNTAGNDFIMYSFANIEGYIKISEYTGNGNADGSFVYCGFLPKVIWLKRYDTTGNWNCYKWDYTSVNSGYISLGQNEIDTRVEVNTTDNRSISTPIDFLSNGFKIRVADGDINVAGGKYLVMAWASNPFQYATSF